MTEKHPRSSTRHPALAALGWAAFLACSWTWCIGMFLPALLVRDYGTWAWVVFALPNVVGAAAMGWVLQREEASARMVGRHSGAMVMFSAVTILFHVLFVGWVVRWLGSWTSVGEWGMVAAAGGAAVVFFPLVLSRRIALILSSLLIAGSVTAFVIAALDFGQLPPPGGAATIDLAPLAAVCVFGFVLCPYLDLTFHRARQATTVYGSIASFTIGFGALFLAMIVFTLWYAPLVLPPGSTRGAPAKLSAVVALAIAAHMSGQSGFTVAAHSVEIVRRLRTKLRAARWGLLAGVLYGGGILGATYYLRQRCGYHDLSAEEVGYRLFMAFYGLVAPAYVWIVLMPWPGGTRSTERRRWTAFIIAVVLAAPAYWIAFIEQQMIWALAGLSALLLARVIVEKLPPASSASRP